MPPALKVNGIAKRYRIGAARDNHDSLRAALTAAAKAPFRKLIGSGPAPATDEPTELWALRDVSFQIDRGQVIGIIGRNGAGKSTLLKILSRITAPTRGNIEVFGSIASLLEVGTGFQPDLTGRENIFLNGSILGMPRALIRQRFDEIVAFAEISRFIDTPVKYYSSGMYVRLAFAIAAHLTSEILLLDEVLAVGDVSFQKKCLAKMDDVAESGRTVLLVSHTMSSIRQLCARTILIEQGRVIADGPTAETMRAYSESLRKQKIDGHSHLKARTNGLSGAIRFTSFRMEDRDGNECFDFKEGEPMRLRVTWEAFDDAADLVLFFALSPELNEEFVTSIRHVLTPQKVRRGQTGEAVVDFPNNVLMPGEYHPYVWLGSQLGNPYDRINYALTYCPPLIIHPRSLEPRQAEGYFRIDSQLRAGSL